MSGSPRPTFDRPTVIAFADVTRHIWGDAQSGRVDDWIYVSSSRIHQLVFGLPPGGCFRHSEAHRTVFAADEIYYVISGVLALANPASGEVQRVLPGEAAFFRRDTWHHGFSCGSEPLRVLELFAPPPSQGTSSAYARTQPYLRDCDYSQSQWLGNWPMARETARRTGTLQVLRHADMLWLMVGSEHPVLTGLWASTEHLAVGEFTLLPGQSGDFETHEGDESLYVLEGELTVTLADAADSLPVLKARDGCYLPSGTAHRYRNQGNAPVRVIFGVAPHYRPQASFRLASAP